LNEFLDIVSNTLPENCFMICEARGEIAKHLEISAERALRGVLQTENNFKAKAEIWSF